MDNTKQWYFFLTLAKWCYNSSYHSNINMSHFQAMYDYSPQTIKVALLEMVIMATVGELLQKRNGMNQGLQRQIDMIRNKMKQMANKRRTKKTFMVGE